MQLIHIFSEGFERPSYIEGSVDCADIFFEPADENPDILDAYVAGVASLGRRSLQHSFLWAIASRHLYTNFVSMSPQSSSSGGLSLSWGSQQRLVALLLSVPTPTLTGLFSCCSGTASAVLLSSKCCSLETALLAAAKQNPRAGSKVRELLALI